MKFCTEQMLNFWTLGFYGLCCKGRINYNRWLDRHLVWKGGTPKGYNNQFRVFDDKLTCVQNLKMFGLNALGGCLGIFPIIGALWPVAQVAQWYRYKLDLLNMKFGGAQPFFVKEFTACNYTIKYYTIGVCGLCSMPVKKYTSTRASSWGSPRSTRTWLPKMQRRTQPTLTARPPPLSKCRRRTRRLPPPPPQQRLLRGSNRKDDTGAAVAAGGGGSAKTIWRGPTS